MRRRRPPQLMATSARRRRRGPLRKAKAKKKSKSSLRIERLELGLGCRAPRLGIVEQQRQPVKSRS